jgi:hypothetical protein
MLSPTKHEDLNKNTLVLGSEVLRYLKCHGSSLIEDIFQNLKLRFDISIDMFYDVIVFLWLIDAIVLNDSMLEIKTLNT